MNAIKTLLSVGVLALTVCLTSCKKEIITSPTGDLAICTMLPNPDGMSGTCWLQLTEGFSTPNLDNSKAFQIGFGIPPRIFGEDIFCFPDYGHSNTLIKYSYTKERRLEKTGELELPSNSFTSHGLYHSKEKAYLATMMGKVLIINPTTMELIKEISLMEYAVEGVAFPQIGLPLINGDKMYLPLWHVDANRIPQKKGIDILVLDTKTDKVLERIQDDADGLTSPCYPYGETGFVDERGDMYFVCGGAFSTHPEFKTGIIRIKKGTSEIDPSYKWVFNDQAIEGEKEGNKTSWLETGYYAGNGKYYITADMPCYWANPKVPDWLRDKSVIMLEIDIWAKTVRKLPIPNTCSYATHITKYKDQLLFSVFGEKGSGYYTYNPQTGKASEKPVITTSGYPFWIQEMK